MSTTKDSVMMQVSLQKNKNQKLNKYQKTN